MADSGGEDVAEDDAEGVVDAEEASLEEEAPPARLVISTAVAVDASVVVSNGHQHAVKREVMVHWG